jgi:Flp pilus assembly protein TadD
VNLCQLDLGIEQLLLLPTIVPQHSNACEALGIAYQKKGDLAQAREATSRVLSADPKNPVALKNLGAILGRVGDSLRALYFIRQSYQANPQDPQTVYCLAFAYMEMGDIEQA